ncbi:MAG: acyl carrier protein [Polyangiales bacterium]|jgi:acyl carrier protein
MAHETLKDDVRNLIAEIVERDPATIADDVPLRDLGVDSMQAIEIITDLEKRYKLKIAESEYRHVSTLSSVVEFLKTKLP